MGLIYMYTNKINGKQYIGQTIHSISRRAGYHLTNYIKSSPKFGRAILKYGYENFSSTILHDNIEDKSMLDAYESLYIELYNTIENGYNIAEGGYSLHDKGVYEKSKQTQFRKYNSWYLETAQFKAVSKARCMERYGTEYYLQSEDYRKKNKITLESKYGVDNVFKSDDIKQKIKATNLKKYGVEHPQQCPEIKARTLKSRVDNGTTTPIYYNNMLFDTIVDAYNYAKEYDGYKKSKDRFKIDCYCLFMSKKELASITWEFDSKVFKTIRKAYLYAVENNLTELKIGAFYELMYKTNIYNKRSD